MFIPFYDYVIRSLLWLCYTFITNILNYLFKGEWEHDKELLAVEDFSSQIAFLKKLESEIELDRHNRVKKQSTIDSFYTKWVLFICIMVFCNC